jgi:hypothetical protein
MKISKLAIDSVGISSSGDLITDCSITLDDGQSINYVSNNRIDMGSATRFEGLGGTTSLEAKDALGEDYIDQIAEALIKEAKKKYASSFAAMIVSATDDPSQALITLGDIVNSLDGDALWSMLSDIESVAHRIGLHDADPYEEFTADAGRDYGQVRAYKMGDWYVIQYGDNGETNYATDYKTDDLAVWLIPDALAGVDLAICIANTRGIGAVVAAEDDHDGPCKILRTRDYYGPYSRTDLLDEDFDDYAAAQAWIESVEADVYVTNHNEIGRPTYTIISD